MIPRLFIAIEMALQLGIDIFSTKDVDEFLCYLFGFSASSVVKCARQRSIAITRQTNEPFCVFSQLIERHCTLARLCMLRHAQLHQSDQTAKILIAGAIANDDRQDEC